MSIQLLKKFLNCKLFSFSFFFFFLNKFAVLKLVQLFYNYFLFFYNRKEIKKQTKNICICVNFFKETIATFQYLLWAINLIWQSAHRWTIAWLTLIILQGLLPIVNIYLTRDLVNHLVPVSKNNFNDDSLQSILIIVIALGIILILSHTIFLYLNIYK